MNQGADPRNLTTGLPIPSEGYCDQPYVVRADDGAWLCCLTTGPGKEGEPGQHVVAIRSSARGRTWSAPVDVEPSSAPESSYSVLLKTPAGRIYCFYNFNADNLRAVKGDPAFYKDGLERRVDSVGQFVFRYSDDGGRSWSAKRHVVPVRGFEIDRQNPYGGKVRFGWNVGRPFVLRGAAYVSFHKVGGFGDGFFTRSEGAVLRSDNLLTEPDPEKVRWETLPEGDVGLCAPAGGGPIAEEQSYVTLSDGSIYCIYRTVDGRPAESYSRDGGRTWNSPEYARYADGRTIRHPRAANFAWKCANGRFLYWFHNNGWTGYNNGAGAGSRNVAWLAGGVERDGRILWSQPEIVLYDPDFFSGPSYPDLVEEDGRYFLTETQKTVARVHELDAALLEGLWGQFEVGAVTSRGLLLDLPADGRMPERIAMPALPEFSTRDYWGKSPGRQDLGGGFSLDLWLRLDSLEAGQVILDSRTEAGVGLALVTTARGTLELVMNDGRSESRWDCDPGVLEAGRPQHIVVSVDGGPRVISFVIDGRLNDGAGRRMYGWGRFSPVLRGANGSKELAIAPGMSGEIMSLRIYGRCLGTSEAVGNWKAEKDRLAPTAKPVARTRKELVK
ncbi:MAG TPA: hypothetical protein PK280_04360 [Planctomycetota bacterium]|nr:hypothetical protein [Planctomycetota bacterium]